MKLNKGSVHYVGKTEYNIENKECNRLVEMRGAGCKVRRDKNTNVISPFGTVLHFQNGFLVPLGGTRRCSELSELYVLDENREVKSFFLSGCLGSGVLLGTPVICEYIDGADCKLAAPVERRSPGASLSSCVWWSWS